MVAAYAGDSSLILNAGRLAREIVLMRSLISNLTARRGLANAANIIFVSTLLAGAASTLAQGKAQKKFESPQKATQALFIAVDKDDKPAIMAILGAPKALICTPDQTQYKMERTRFVLKYQEMRRLVREPDGTTVLYIGAENWQFPFPLVASKGSWHFDSAAGIREVVFRRIGENETQTIETCKALVRPNEQVGSVPADSAKLMHGYYIRRVASHQPSNGKAIVSNISSAAKFAFIAYPAEYRSSGVMTFMVNTEGVVYAKDLGPESRLDGNTSSVLRPDTTWAVEK